MHCVMTLLLAVDIGFLWNLEEEHFLGPTREDGLLGRKIKGVPNVLSLSSHGKSGPEIQSMSRGSEPC